MTTSPSPVSAIEAIEKAMEGVTPGLWLVHWDPDEAGGAFVSGDGMVIADMVGAPSYRRPNAAYIAACSPDRMREVLAAARANEQLAIANGERALEEYHRAEALARKAEALTGIGSAHDLINDWLVESTEDLPDDTPVRIEIGNRTIIGDNLGSLRRARALLGGENAGN